MIVSFQSVHETEVRTDVLILPFSEDYPLDIYADLDDLTGGLIAKVTGSKEFTGKHREVLLLHLRGMNADRLLLVGLGKQSDRSPEKVRQAGGKAFCYLRDTGMQGVSLSTRLFNRLPGDLSRSRELLFSFMEGGLLGLYRFEKFRKSENGKEIQSVTVLDEEREFPLRWLQTSISAVDLARDLVNTPANEMTPAILSAVAQSLSGGKLSVQVLEREEIEREGMGAYLSVTRGSLEPPKFIVLRYEAGQGSPLVLIGKTITFDSGGLSIKPAEGMEKMKYDMAGGAAVLGVMKALSELDVAVNVVGILPAAENLLSGSPSRPGDVVRTINGKTVEIISTDAEGRLTLADAMGYAIKYMKPRAMIDIATLTGACSIAFGNEAIAMMGNDTELMDGLRRASEETYERVWQMPLFEEYLDYIKSDVADMKNSGGRKGSLVAAGCFLKEFVGETPWVHLDIAGTAWIDKDRPYLPKGATGVGVRLLLNFLKELA